jgi:Putative transposase
MPYFHVVFTLPSDLGPIALYNPRQVYGLLMQAAAETLLELAADPKHLRAKIGVLTVLHTWGQNLALHPHVHCVVTGGGLSPDETTWIGCPDRYLLPFQILSRVFRGKFLAALHNTFKRGQLHFGGELGTLADPKQFDNLLSASVRTDWVVYVKPPWGGPELVLKYLARYTHRAAISNRRLVSLEDGRVSFRWKDYARGGRHRTMMLAAIEFVRRFMTHVLPSGFVRIRHYGILANRHRREKLAWCRELLRVTPTTDSNLTDPITTPEPTAPLTPIQVCPICSAGRMIVIAELPPMPLAQEILDRPNQCLTFDSS